MNKPRFGRGPKNQKTVLINDTSIKESFSITCILGIRSGVYFEGRKNSNSSFDFLFFCIDCIEKGYLITGDFLVIDNATVHEGESMEILDDLLLIKNIQLIRLPTYSPELNPTEKVFGFVKSSIYKGDAMNMSLNDFLIEKMSTITNKHILEWYRHSIIYLGQ